MTRDNWGGDANSPMSYNVWLYVYGNPINFTDPKGLYGDEVHKGLTRDLVLKSIYLNPMVSYNAKLPDLIVSWDYYVDFGPTLHSVLACGPCHFMPYDRTMQHIEDAIRSGEPYIFGAVLHQVQDYYSHWQEGYHDQLLGHLFTSIVARNQDLLDDFFKGEHRTRGKGGMAWRSSPFPAHPHDEVVQEIKRRNPGIDLSGLTDWELVDLYLRSDISSPFIWEILAMRNYFGFNTDFYEPTSFRDSIMKSVSQTLIDDFLQEIPIKAGCYTMVLAPEEINAFIVGGIEPFKTMERTVRAYLTR